MDRLHKRVYGVQCVVKQTEVWADLFGGKLWKITFPLIIHVLSVLSVFFSVLFSVTLFTVLFHCLLNSLTYYPSCAVSRKQMRNLKYRLRYPGLMFWPSWMHQFPHHKMLSLSTSTISHSLLSPHLGFPFLLPCMLSHHWQTERPPLPGFNLHHVVQHGSSFLECLWLKMSSYSKLSEIFITCASSLDIAALIALESNLKLTISIKVREITKKAPLISIYLPSFVLQFSCVRRVKGENIFVRHINLMLEVGKKIWHEGILHAGSSVASSH